MPYKLIKYLYIFINQQSFNLECNMVLSRTKVVFLCQLRGKDGALTDELLFH